MPNEMDDSKRLPLGVPRFVSFKIYTLYSAQLEKGGYDQLIIQAADVLLKPLSLQKAAKSLRKPIFGF